MLITTVAALFLLSAFVPAPVPAPAPPHTAARRHVAAPPRRQTRSRTRHAHSASSGVSDARALQLQKALQRAGYLDKTSGHWDAATRAAMTRYQKDHDWQTHYVPDARAIIALGLGPAMDTIPTAAAAQNASPRTPSSATTAEEPDPSAR